ncbi:MAG: glycoside hydrolase family 3 protein [Synergistaceae bacterium]|nr:glycoside hydrolase family 3 protein [Synergistaceae bacterium]
MSKKILTLVLATLLIFSSVSSVCAAATVSSVDKENVKTETQKTEAKRKAAFAKALKEENISEMVKNMTIEEKITQTLMMSFENQLEGKDTLPKEVKEIIKKYRFGSILLFSGNLKTIKDTFQLTKDMQSAATEDNGIPLIIATDQEGGRVYHLGSGTALSGNMAISATGEVANAKKAGQIIGKEILALGLHTPLAPVLDINNNAQNPVIGIRSFGDTPEVVSKFGVAEIQGIAEVGAISCAKHFPGHGDTNVDSHAGLPIINKTLNELKRLELIPFKNAITAGVDMIMTAHILYPKIDNTKILSEKTGKYENRPATLSKIIITDILKNPSELNFQGVVITDSMHMQGISTKFNSEQAVIETLKAGADLICKPVSYCQTVAEVCKKLDVLIQSVKKSILSKDADSLSMERLDDAVTRILTLKKNKGLLSYSFNTHNLNEAMNTVGNKEHRNLERILATKGVTVVRNNNNILPLRVESNAHVLMLCPKPRFSALSVSMMEPLPASMIMGWNRAKAAGLVPNSAEVRYYVFSEDDYTVQGKLKVALDWADAVIVCSNVSRASDMMADFWTSACPRNVTNYCHKKNKKSIVMSVHIPYDAQLYKDADAIVLTYGYRGSRVDPEEAIEKTITTSEQTFGPNVVAGVEVILGCFGAFGRLPVEIPYFDLTSGTFDSSNIIYQRGYGLTYDVLK